MSKQRTPQFGLCIDWETSGATWGGDSSKDYQGVAIGVVVFDTTTFDPVEKLYCEIKFDETRFKWQDEAEKVHGLSREYLEENGINREEAAVEVASLIMKYFDPKDPIMFLGHNREFDIAFTKQLLEEFGVMFKIHHVNLDTSGIGFVTLGYYKSDLLFEAVGLDARGTHNALEDALCTLEVCRRIRYVINQAVEGK
jgi:DNA polymerase III epsilon subunit-like protein